MDPLHASKVSTHFYKLAHVANVSYTIYTTGTPTTDQTLLELELAVRHAHPHILVTYYKKELYYFAFKLGDFNLVTEYPQLSAKASDVLLPELLASTGKDDETANVSLAFSKAVKKLFLYNLSLHGVCKLFGNNAVVPAGTSYYVLHVDPVLLANGDLVSSMVMSPQLVLFDSLVLTVGPKIDQSFIIYLSPSGIRCHLFDTANPALSFTYTPPKNCAELMRLLKLSTGVDLSAQENELWVKLIPNLQHLNNQTSNIARFIHSVDNKKYITWPWALCLLQFGHAEPVAPLPQHVAAADPLSLIADFMDFNISHKLAKKPALPPLMPLVLQTGTPAVDSKDPELLTMDIFPEPDFFPSSQLTFLTPDQPKKEQSPQDIDDLFGDVSEDEEEIIQLPMLPPEISEEQVVIPDRSFIDIPPEEMMLKSAVYDDPGAPLPAPTPPLTDEEKSIFSPIIFNPIIKSNIDTKYGKGGKFYVEKDPADDRKRKIRATSVSGFDYPQKRVVVEAPSDESILDDTESDEDTDDVPSFSSPLKLNTLEAFDAKSTQPHMFSSPLPATALQSTKLGPAARFDSPGFSEATGVSPGFFEKQALLPLEFDSFHEEKKEALPPKNGVSESSNCLPLILRGINVNLIPNVFLLNNVVGPVSISTVPLGFMDVDEENDLDINRHNELAVKVANLDEFLHWLSQNLLFDLGLNKYNTQIALPVSADPIDEADFDAKLTKVFPLCYKVNLHEFVDDLSPEEVSSEEVNHLSFLDEIANDELLNPKSQLQKLNSLTWNFIDDKPEPFARYRQIIKLLPSRSDDDHVFVLSDNKAKVLKHNEIINLNSVGLRFWNYLKFGPVNGPKKVQVLCISDNTAPHHTTSFLEALTYNFNENRLGDMHRLLLQDQRDYHGLLLFEPADDMTQAYHDINKKLIALVELIKLDLINKTNRFEFDRPLLLLFVNFDPSVNAMVQIAKICRNFKLHLTNHQLPLVEVFSHVVPASFVFKQAGPHRHVRYLSNQKLLRLSMTLYNKCPTAFVVKKNNRVVKSLYTHLVRTPPTKLHFKFLGKDNLFALNDDIFLHLAYERSIDRNWLVAAWLDPLGITTYTKAWYCLTNKARTSGDVHDMAQVTNEMWEISTDLFKKLNEEVIKRTCGLGGKTFLVLTRVNSVIPDDELVHWKRLSVKHKEVLLIVLSVGREPRSLFASEGFEPPAPLATRPVPPGPGTPLDFFKFPLPTSSNSSPTTTGAMVASPSHGMLHLPHQFLNAPTNFLSPQDMVSTGTNTSPTVTGTTGGDGDVIIHDQARDVCAVIPRIPLPSFTSPARLGMKVGYLVKECGLDKYQVYETTLLSCSNFWKLDLIMRILLDQFKKLITLNDVLGIDIDEVNLVPWHVHAVGRMLDYLVHIEVQRD